MGMNITKKILSAHLAAPSEMKPGEEILLKVDHSDSRYQCSYDVSGF